MSAPLEQLTNEAMGLPPRQKLALAENLLISADASADCGGDAEWDAEIRERIRAIDEGRVERVLHDEVMRKAEVQLAP